MDGQMTENEATYKLSREHNVYPNIKVYDRYYNGEVAGWKVTANQGFVFYDTAERNVGIDPETMEPTLVTYYSTEAILTRYFNWADFSFVAVPRNRVNETV
jgi:hypothetical protein